MTEEVKSGPVTFMDDSFVSRCFIKHDEENMEGEKRERLGPYGIRSTSMVVGKGSLSARALKKHSSESLFRSTRKRGL